MGRGAHVTSRLEFRHQPTRNRARGIAVAALATVATITAMPAPAQAAVPAVAQTWSNLMTRSLTGTPEAAKLRSGLVTQQAAFATRVAELAAAKRADAAAQVRLTEAVTHDTAAQARYTAAAQALTDAKKALAAAGKLRPRNRTAVATAKTVVTKATTTAGTRKTQALQAAAVLRLARTEAATAATGLTGAIAAWKAASGAVQLTRQKIAALSTPADLAAQAAALSRDVVTQVRPAFTVADTTVVYGVTVHRTVAFAFKRMIDDAKADGIALSGGGFRTKQRQIELRTINGCPDVWTAPSSSCRVPTAIPGRSLHEIGLAVDITAGGRTLTAKSPGFAWMTAHAAEYGFVNLPSEAWHWSITGG
jgi:zinc D-Ala-D-Ala carboxypeptidase